MAAILWALFLVSGLAALPFTNDGAQLLEAAQRNAREQFKSARWHGAVAKVTPDRRSFYIYWSPQSEPQEAEPASRRSKKKGAKKKAPRPKADRLLVTLHGESRWAIDEFFSWRELAAERNTAVLAVQWWFGKGEEVTDYYSPHDLHRNIDEIVESLGYPPGKVMVQGNNRAGSILYGLAGLDRTEGRRLYALLFANAGGADRDIPINRMLEKGGFGRTPLKGTRWALYCGRLDSRPGRDGCPAMAKSEKWLTRLGGEVSLIIEDPDAGNSGFYQSRDHMASVLDLFSRLVPGEPVIVVPKRPKAKRKPRPKPKAKPKPKPEPEPEAELEPQAEPEPQAGRESTGNPADGLEPPEEPPAQETSSAVSLPAIPQPGSSPGPAP